MPLRLVPSSAVLPILQGRLRGKRWIVGSHTHGCWLGSYEFLKQKRFAQTVRDGMVVYDIGAHVGFYTLLAAECVGAKGEVVAFEPLPRNLRLLRQHLALNGYANVSVIEAAVADASGTATFVASQSHSEGRLGLGGASVCRSA